MPIQRPHLTKRKHARDEAEDPSSSKAVADEAAATFQDDPTDLEESTSAQQVQIGEADPDWATTEVLHIMNTRLKEEMASIMDQKLDALLQALQLGRSNSPNEAPRHTPPNQTVNPPSRIPSPTDRSVGRNSSIHHENELIREIMKQIPRYDGTGGTQKLLEYIDNVELYLSTAEVTSQSELNLAVSKLTGDARMWWRDHQQRIPLHSSERIHNWEALKKALLQLFTPPEHSEHVREKLLSIKQTGSIAEYNAAFRRFSMQLTDLSFAEEKHAYFRGLDPRIRDLIRTQTDLNDIRSIQIACLRFDTYKIKPKRDDGAYITESTTTMTKRHNPRDRDRGRGRGKGRGTERPPRDLSKITCAICDNTGHFTHRCPKLPELKARTTSTKTGTTDGAEAHFVHANTVIIDSGASQHMTNDKTILESFKPIDTPVTLGNSTQIKALGTGIINMDDKFGGLTLDNVLYVPALKHNLLSVSALNKTGNDITFTRDGIVKLTDKNYDTQVIGKAHSNLYHLTSDETDIGDEIHTALTTSKIDPYVLWHHRLGHPGHSTLRIVHTHVDGITDLGDKPINDVCEGCQYGKSHRLPFGDATHRATEVLGRVHTDLCGPMPIPSPSGARYALTFIDDTTRMTKVYFLEKKSDTLSTFIRYRTYVEKQTGKSLKILRSDGGGEYINKEMQDYLSAHGIRHETTTANTPQQNGVAERFNRTMFNSLRAMMHTASVPRKLWAELAATAVYLRNRLPTRVNNDQRSPYECWFGRKPVVDHLRILWSDAYVHIPKSKRTKLDYRAQKLKLIGYHDEKKAYKLWNPDQERMEISRDVKFDESVVLNNTPSPHTIEQEDYVVEAIVGEREINGEKQYFVKWLGYDDSENTWEPHSNVADLEALDKWENRTMALFTIVETELTTVAQALSTPDASKWQEAINNELSSLYKNNTWTVIDNIPEGRKPVGCRWIFARKFKSDGSIDKYKARLVAKGYSQHYGVDYTETYAPVAKFASIRTILAIGAALDLEIHQMDVKTAFLHGELEEDVYVTVPDGVNAPPNAVCKLNRSLYGLKQSPRMWNKRINDHFHNAGFTRLNADHGVYIRRDDTTLAIITLYVDDLIILTDSLATMESIKHDLESTFEMTDNGDLYYCLGLEVTRDRTKRHLQLNQSNFIRQVLSRFNMTDCNSIATPLDPSIQLKAASEEDELVDPTLFRQIVGSLMFIMIGTRPDLAATISIISQFAAKPTQTHLQAAKRVLRYLKGTMDYKLNFDGDKNDMRLTGYCDSNWGNDLNTRRSTSGYLFYLCGGVVSWSSKCQPTVALSSTEAEYMALTHATKETIWLRLLLQELGFPQYTTVLYGDNQSSHALSKNPIHHQRTKHIDIQYHFVREKVLDNTISLEYIPTNIMIADALTKALPKPRFSELVKLMNLHI